MVDHVRESDEAYVVQLGARVPRSGGSYDPVTARALRERAVRERAVSVLAAHAAGAPIEDASRVARPWTPRYYVRRAAWHALDHAWELEDRRIG
jgi:hypothetical protein